MVKKQDKSEKYQLNKEDMSKIGKGAVIAIGGALLTYATEILPQIEWGEYSVLIMGASSVLINFAWKLLRAN